MKKELKCIFDRKKSFYGKANIKVEGNKLILISYGSEVAFIKDNKPLVMGVYSQTTSRHIKEFLKQNGFKAETSKQILEDYGVKE